MAWTKEDDEIAYQMSITHPICTVCKDSGFYTDFTVNPPERKPCENCNV